jgi:hypothetical protein
MLFTSSFVEIEGLDYLFTRAQAAFVVSGSLVQIFAAQFAQIQITYNGFPVVYIIDQGLEVDIPYPAAG